VGELLERGDLLYGVTTGVGALRTSPSAHEDPGATSGSCCARTRAAAARR
jgi:hypothetical protein